MPSCFVPVMTCFFLAGGLVHPVSAQTSSKPPDSPDAAPLAKAAEAVRQPAPTGSDTAPKSDAGGKTSPGASVQLSDDFARADTDRDGRVSAQEYAGSDVAAVDMVAAGKRDGTEAPRGGFGLRDNEGRPDRSIFFRQRDADHDGYLSRSELGLPGQP